MEEYKSREEQELDKLREELEEIYPVLVAELTETLPSGIAEVEAWANEGTGNEDVDWLKRELLGALYDHLIYARARELRETYAPHSRTKGRGI